MSLPELNTPSSVLSSPLTVIPVDFAPLKRMRSYWKRKTTTAIVKPSTPDFRISNPFNISAKVYSITLLPDASAKTKMFIQILQDDDELIYISGGDMTDTSSINVPFPIQGKSIDPQKFIDVFIWTTDGTSSNLTISASIGVS